MQQAALEITQKKSAMQQQDYFSLRNLLLKKQSDFSTHGENIKTQF